MRGRCRPSAAPHRSGGSTLDAPVLAAKDRAGTRSTISHRRMHGLRSEIRLDDRWILYDLARTAVRDLRAFLDDDDVSRHREDGPHDVFNDERPEANFLLDLGEHADCVAQFLRRQTGEDFVEEEDPRSRPKDPGEFEPLSLLDGQVRGDRIRLAFQSYQREDSAGGFQGFRL